MKLDLFPYRLETKGTFKIAHGSRNHTDTLITCLSAEGQKGYGEAAHVPYYGIAIEDSLEALEKVKDELGFFLDKTHEEFNAFLVEKLEGNHFAICAMDMAFWDLKAKLNSLILSDYIQKETKFSKQKKLPLSNFTIGIGTIDEMLEKVKASDFPILKIKLGTEADNKLIRAIRNSTEATLRIDANTGWKTQDAIYLSEVMNQNGVEFIEQPFTREAYEEMAQLRQSVNATFIADESCKFETDLEKCIGAFDGINIKLSKCGGITPALRMIQKARATNMKIMIGCMTESSIGISALSHLLPFVDYADLDGALLINNDPAFGVKIVKGEAIFRSGFGHGGQLV